ncbi:MAG TPA: hypothetical protein VHK01_22265 [Lacipirellulaceae bacterium]|jgi:hypothetical protein|nr:hypothetical protein [Lacipirellulaceae bacterium]
MSIWPTARSWKRLAIGLALLTAVALIANGFMAWRTESQLQSRIAAIRTAGDPASIADLAPEPIPNAENAAAILAQLAPRIDAFSKEYAQFSTSAMGEALDERDDKGEPPLPEQLAAIRAMLDKYPDIPAGLAAAAKCEKYASMADFLVDHVKFLNEPLKGQAGRIRNAARFLEWRAEVLLADGQNEAVVEQGIDLLRLARLHDAEPMLVSYLVGVAVRGYAINMLYDGLAAGPVRAELHVALDKELALHDTPQRIVHALKSDRAYSASVAAEAGVNPAFTQVPFYGGVIEWPMKRQFIGAMDYLDAQIALVADTWPSANKQIGPAGPPVETGPGTMAELLIPAIEASYLAEARITATMRALRIFNALAQYRAEHGREATGLNDLSLPASATIDPFDDEPLKLKHTDEGWIVYTVMNDGEDDGGDFKELKDYGVAPRKWRVTE